MDNMQIAKILLYVLGFVVIVFLALICVAVFYKYKMKKESSTTRENNGEKKSKIQESYSVQSIFDFMDFEKIEDNMIVQKKGKKFLMAIKCQGINYDLMSGVEKTSVEQGFLQYLNTLRYPIQIYVQTKTVDLTGSINTYKRKIEDLENNLARKEFAYNQKVRSGNYGKNELDRDNFEIVKARKLYEYGKDIVSSTERMSLNRNILSKQYYIIISYFYEEGGDYSPEEISNMAFSELYTRAQSTISLLSVCGINGKVLDSFELADLLYTAYNRDEAETYDLKKAIDSGFDNVYSTAPDVLDKKMKELDKQIKKDAEDLANEVLYKARIDQEKEEQIKQKEEQYDDLVNEMARLILNSNKNVIDNSIVERAQKELTEKKGKKQIKEEKTNEQKAKRTRRSSSKTA